MALTGRERARLRSLLYGRDLLAQIYDYVIERFLSESVIEDLSSQLPTDTFTTTYKYISGTLEYYENGILQSPDSLGYVTQSDPDNKEFQTSSTVLAGKTVVVKYRKQG